MITFQQGVNLRVTFPVETVEGGKELTTEVGTVIETLSSGRVLIRLGMGAYFEFDPYRRQVTVEVLRDSNPLVPSEEWSAIVEDSQRTREKLDRARKRLMSKQELDKIHNRSKGDGK